MVAAANITRSVVIPFVYMLVIDFVGVDDLIANVVVCLALACTVINQCLVSLNTTRNIIIHKTEILTHP